jgi:hypothetical protein
MWGYLKLKKGEGKLTFPLSRKGPNKLWEEA